MNASTILCLAALVALAGCERHERDATPAPEAAASDNSAFLEGADGVAAAASAASAPEPAAASVPIVRGPPPVVPDIVRDGIRYRQGDAERDAGLPQGSGMLVVYDDLSGKRLWTLAVYSEGADAKKAPDARWIFFKAMDFDTAGRLRVVNEAGETFLVDVKSHTSTPVAAK